MSFVLDALKRSEQDRNQGQMPHLVDQGNLMHLSRPRRPWWPYVLIAVLLLNAGVFLYIKLSDSKASAVTPALGDARVSDVSAQDSPERTPRDATSAAVSASVLSEAPESHSATVLFDAAQSTEPVSQASGGIVEKQIDWSAREERAKRMIAEHNAKQAQPRSENNALVRIDPKALPGNASDSAVGVSAEYDVIAPKSVPKGGALAFPEPIVTPALAMEDAQVPQSSYENVRFLYELDRQTRPRVPSLKFNSHIFSETPSARRVMINNIYLREGQEFLGMEVVEIGEFNITFGKGGQLFKLPAMRDWNE